MVTFWKNRDTYQNTMPRYKDRPSLDKVSRIVNPLSSALPPPHEIKYWCYGCFTEHFALKKPTYHPDPNGTSYIFYHSRSGMVHFFLVSLWVIWECIRIKIKRIIHENHILWNS